MTDHVADIKTYTANVNEAAVAAIVTYCGIALQRADSSLVSASDPKELATVRDGFAAKKLGLKPRRPMPASRRWSPRCRPRARKAA